MATKKPSTYSNWIPPLMFGGFFLAIVIFPYARKYWFPDQPERVVQIQEKVVKVEVEKEKLVHDRPTITINSIKINVVSVTDGDTITATLELPLDVSLVNQKVRCLGYDAYELSELKGLEAKGELENLLKDSTVFGMTSKKNRDSFGRYLLTLYCRKGDNVIDVSKWMTDKGFVKPIKALEVEEEKDVVE